MFVSISRPPRVGDLLTTPERPENCRMSVRIVPAAVFVDVPVSTARIGTSNSKKPVAALKNASADDAKIVVVLVVVYDCAVTEPATARDATGVPVGIKMFTDGRLLV